MDKKALSERDIFSKFITPAVQRAGWDLQTQVREEVSYTKGRIISAASSPARRPGAGEVPGRWGACLAVRTPPAD